MRRRALRYIGGSLRMAGFYGYASDASVINTSYGNVTTTTDCGSATNTPATNWAINLQVAVSGFQGVTSAAVSTTLPCIAAANFLDVPGGQQILVTRGAIGYRIPDPNNDGNLADGLATQRNYTTTVYVQGDPGEGVIFYGNDFTNAQGRRPHAHAAQRQRHRHFRICRPRLLHPAVQPLRHRHHLHRRRRRRQADPDAGAAGTPGQRDDGSRRWPKASSA